MSYRRLKLSCGLTSRRWRTGLAVAGIGWLAVAGAAAAAETVDFDRDIRPILSDRCFHCHGPDAETRAADLRLDTREGLTAWVVTPGDPEGSELIRRIDSEDADERMPPPETGLSLSAEQRAALRGWVAAGAPFSEHWAFTPLPAEVPLPEVDDTAWVRTPLDRFVQARLEAEGLQPAPAAPAWKLLRRLRLDLTGLPPTPAEAEEFAAAAEVDLEGAVDDAVERLLASPAFGEHLAVDWLDAARYADSHGYQSDQLNTQWPYRDWVIRAFNANLPYDQFLTWQLAGDLLPQATRDQILATAFNRLHRMTNEGGSIPQEWLVENAADRVHTFGTAMLGLTLECARCHDHKYDPITQRDYYQLFAFFNSIDENGLYDHTSKVPSPTLMLPTAEQEQAIAAARTAIDAAQAEYDAAVQGAAQRFAAWRAAQPTIDLTLDLAGRASFDEDDPASMGLSAFSEAGGVDANHPAPPPETVAGRHGRAIRCDGDRRVAIATREEFTTERHLPFSLDLWIHPAPHDEAPQVLLQQTSGTDVGFSGFDMLLRNGHVEARLFRVWPGNALGVRSREPLAVGQWQRLTLTYDGSSRAAGFRLYRDGVAVPLEVVRDRIAKRAYFPQFGDGRLALAGRFRDRGLRDGLLDEVRLYRRELGPLEAALLAQAEPTPGVPLPADVDEEALRAYYLRAVDAEVREKGAQLAAAREQLLNAEEVVHEVAVMDELAEPRPAYVLARGAYDAPRTDAARVERDVFANILPRFPADAPRNRLGLAQWLVDPDHPLAARVAVNRIWANFFGRPLAATPDNFGSQGTRPEYPELLDWLARDFVAHGWDVKRLCRQIVDSAVYRQDSRASRDLRERDPQNALLARGPSRRLKAEQIRDLALASSGLLVGDVGGPPVAPYQAGGDLWREANSMSPAYHQSTGPGLHRRSLYSVWKRTAPLPNMLAFDAPTREVCSVYRSRTSTPLQALVLLNDVQFVEAARALALSVAESCDEPAAQLSAAFLRLTGRKPLPRELEVLQTMYAEQQALFADEAAQDPAKLAALGEAARPATPDDPALAALTVCCQAMLNLDASIYQR